MIKSSSAPNLTSLQTTQQLSTQNKLKSSSYIIPIRSSTKANSLANPNLLDVFSYTPLPNVVMCNLTTEQKNSNSPINLDLASCLASPPELRDNHEDEECVVPFRKRRKRKHVKLLHAHVPA